MWYFPIIYCITHTYNHFYIAGIGDVIVSFKWRRVSFSNTLFDHCQNVPTRRRTRAWYATRPFSKLLHFRHADCRKMKWNESGFRPPLCTYRLNWARRTSWGWWDEWDNTVLQTQDLKFDPWRSEAEYATSRSRRLPTILSFTSGYGRNIFVSFEPPKPGTEPRTLAWKSAVLTTTLGPPPTGCRASHVALVCGVLAISAHDHLGPGDLSPHFCDLGPLWFFRHKVV